MLKITDLTASKELESKEMASVCGGWDPMSILASTTIDNKVADVTQAFAFDLGQANKGKVTNNQAFHGGNGTIHAPVEQYQHQSNDMFVYDIGNTSVS